MKIIIKNSKITEKGKVILDNKGKEDIVISDDSSAVKKYKEDLLFQIEHIKDLALSEYDNRFLYERMIEEEIEELRILVKNIKVKPPKK